MIPTCFNQHAIENRQPILTSNSSIYYKFNPKHTDYDCNMILSEGYLFKWQEFKDGSFISPFLT